MPSRKMNPLWNNDAPPTDAPDQSPPDIAALRERVAAPLDDAGLAALFKPTATLTKSEMMAALGSAMDRSSNDPLRRALYDKVGQWHDLNYGLDPQAFDDTGRPVPPSPVRPTPDTESPSVAQGGEPFDAALGRVAGHVAGAAERDGPDGAVLALQRGLNLLGHQAPVGEDGVFGPETQLSLHRALADLGPNKVQNGLALGRFNAVARDARAGGNAGDLGLAADAIFAPLFRPSGTGPKPEAEAVQTALNQLGRETRPGWHDIAVDGDIGPQTTGAFRDLLADSDPDELTRRVGANLALI